MYTYTIHYSASGSIHTFRCNCSGELTSITPPPHLFTSLSTPKRLKTPKLYIHKTRPPASRMESQNDHSEVRCPLCTFENGSLSSWPLPAALFQRARGLGHGPKKNKKKPHLMHFAQGETEDSTSETRDTQPGLLHAGGVYSCRRAPRPTHR